MGTVEKSNIAQYMCKRVAVLSDIHSNYHAMKACVEDAEKEGADCFVFLGDYVSGLADVEKTLELVYEIQGRYPTICIRGNRERYMLDHRSGVEVLMAAPHTGSYLFTYDRLREKDIAFFSGLPISNSIAINGVPLEIAHATMTNDRYYFEDDGEKIIDVVSQMKAPYLLTGHSHKQYIYHREGRGVINPGSVGLPQGNGPLAQYALLDISGGQVCCALRRVAYDLEKVIRAQFQSGLVDYAKYWAICDLYGAITGREYTKMLLNMIYRRSDDPQAALCDEKVWHAFAVELGLHFSEEEILDSI